MWSVWHVPSVLVPVIYTIFLVWVLSHIDNHTFGICYIPTYLSSFCLCIFFTFLYFYILYFLLLYSLLFSSFLTFTSLVSYLLFCFVLFVLLFSCCLFTIGLLLVYTFLIIYIILYHIFLYFSFLIIFSSFSSGTSVSSVPLGTLVHSPLSLMLCPLMFVFF